MDIATRTEPSLDEKLAAPVIWGKIAGFTVQELQPNLFKESLKLIERYLIPEETLCVALDMEADPAGRRCLLEHAQRCMRDGTSIVVLKGEDYVEEEAEEAEEEEEEKEKAAAAADEEQNGEQRRSADKGVGGEERGKDVVWEHRKKDDVEGADGVGVTGEERDSVGASAVENDTVGEEGEENDSVGEEGEKNESVGEEGEKNESVGEEGERNESVGEREKNDSVGEGEENGSVGEKGEETEAEEDNDSGVEMAMENREEVTEQGKGKTHREKSKKREKKVKKGADKSEDAGEAEMGSERADETREKREKKRRKRHKRERHREKKGKEGKEGEEQEEEDDEKVEGAGGQEEEEEEEGEQRVVAVMVARVVQRLEHMRSFSRMKVAEGDAYEKWFALRCHLQKAANLFEEFDVDKYYRLYHIVVHPDHRKKGVASFLLRLAALRLTELFAGGPTVCTAVATSRSAQRLLAGQGFRPHTVLKYHEWKDHQGQAIIRDAGVGNYNATLAVYEVPGRPEGEAPDVSPLLLESEEAEDEPPPPSRFPGRDQGLPRPPRSVCSAQDATWTAW